MANTTYNPLEKLNLAQSIKSAILSNDAIPLSTPELAVGSGVYALYYCGSFEPYATISASNSASWQRPIYVGKAIPKGGRKGGFLNSETGKGKALSTRLKKHAASIRSTSNLKLEDFVYRSIALDDIWIPLGENILIETFQPLWNVAIDGFGINDPGSGRLNQKRSAWDILHPGRKYSEKLTGINAELEVILGRVEDHIAMRPLRPLPKAISKVTKSE